MIMLPSLTRLPELMFELVGQNAAKEICISGVRRVTGWGSSG